MKKKSGLDVNKPVLFKKDGKYWKLVTYPLEIMAQCQDQTNH
jgi:hypothetical protein